MKHEDNIHSPIVVSAHSSRPFYMFMAIIAAIIMLCTL